ncbi:MAG TPA: hypothetical protein PKY76_01860 [Bacteroidales bacterium]|nr:hypothetical protein [Bacteroidales bacterium]HPO64678.1 hypothetical protein [Bacteroidales bacterium]
METNEILLSENKDRFVVLPIHYPQVWEHYSGNKGSFIGYRGVVKS